mgnify:FL=1
MIPNEVKDLVRGKYGRTPAPIDPEVKNWLSVTNRRSIIALLTILRRKWKA